MHLTDDQIQEYLDGQLTDDTRLRHHFQSCDLCRARMQQYESLYGSLNRQSDIYLSEDFAEKVTAALPDSPGLVDERPPVRDSVILWAAIILMTAGAIVFLKPYRLWSTLTDAGESSMEPSRHLMDHIPEWLNFLGISPELILAAIGAFATIAVVDHFIVRRFRRGLVSLLFSA